VSLSQKTCVEYLGVLIDSKLDWSSHVQLVRNKLSRAFHLLFKIQKFVPIAVLKILYCTIAFYNDIYKIVICHGVWPAPIKDLHNNILRIMTFSNYGCHVTPFYKNHNVLKLNDFSRFELAKFMHNLHHGALPKIYNIFSKYLLRSFLPNHIRYQ